MTEKPRALLVWELGDNLGHIATLIKVSEDLFKRGYDVYLALQNLTGVAAVIGDMPVKILQAPYAKVKPPRDTMRPVLVYSDDLRPCGYDNPQELSMLLRAWDELFKLVRPSILIANSAPTAILAAQSYDFPKVNIGLGYEVPVLSDPMPPLLYWEKNDVGLLKKHEQSVLAIINEALKILGKETISSIQDIFKDQIEILTTFPELDHYGDRHKNVYVGPMFISDKGKEIAWPEQRIGRKRIFAYLSHGRDFESSIRVLQSLPHDVILVARRLSQEVVHKFNTPSFQIITEAIQLGKIAKDCDLCITHGGTGTLVQFLLHGVPQLIIPNHIEQVMVAKRIESRGMGCITPPRTTPEDISKLIDRILGDSTYNDNTKQWALEHQGYSVDVQIKEIVDRILRTL